MTRQAERRAEPDSDVLKAPGDGADGGSAAESSDRPEQSERRFTDRARLLECVHCGLCLSACPTYVELGTEMDSPRGRIYLMRALEEGRLDLSGDVVRHLDLCLGCRACETACPSGVRYGELIEDARAFIETRYRRSWWDAARRRGALALFPYARRVRAFLAPVRFLQRLRIWTVVQWLLRPARLLPDVQSAPALPELTPASGAERGRIALLAGCVARELFAATNLATVRVLSRHGISVIVPQEALCCGALHLHSGEPESARQRARQIIDSFPSGVDAVLVSAAGCGATMKEYGHLLKHDPQYAERARRFAARVRDVTEYLATIPLEAPAHAIEETVTYHDACHLAHGQGIRDAPRAILQKIPSLDFVELAESDMCCGSAGTYNLVEPAMAARLLDRKLDRIAETGATCVAVANPGCSLQIQAGLRARGMAARVVHPVELLDEAYRGE